MRQQHRVETCFVVAEALWRSALRVKLVSHRSHIESNAVVGTSRGVVARRDCVATESARKPRSITDWCCLALTLASLSAVAFVMIRAFVGW